MCLHILTEEKRMNICSSQAINSSTIHSSSTTMGSGIGLMIDPFPAGLRVLVVDDDLCCLAVLQRKLQKCQYEVTIHDRADVALELLRKDKTGFDIVLSDVHMPDMDGFKLLECVGLEMDLPVIMMSGDDSKDVVMKGVIHGACDYLIKPISIEALKTIWQHVVRKKKKHRKEMEFEQAGIVEDGEQQQNPLEDADYLSSSYEENQNDSNKRKDEAKYMDDRSTSKKPRVVWSAELHQQFIIAVNQIGIDRAVPKKILEVMNVPGLTRENVASHLQKFRLYLRKLSTSSQHQNGLDISFMGPGDVPFGSISSFNGLGLQTLAAPGQMIRPPSLATIQADSLSEVTPKSAMSLPLIDQRNTCSYENKKSRFGEGHTQLNDNSKQMKLFHGIPTNMEPKQLASSLHQYTGTFGNSSHVSGISPYFGQPALSRPFPGGVHTHNVSGALFNPISHTSKGVLQEEVKSDMKDSRGYLANFGDFTDLNQNENRDWGLYNTGPTQHPNTSQQVINSSLADNAPSGAGKLPDMGFMTTPFLEQFNQDDFWSLILQQPEDGIGLVEGEFGFDGYHLENLPA